MSCRVVSRCTGSGVSRRSSIHHRPLVLKKDAEQQLESGLLLCDGPVLEWKLLTTTGTLHEKSQALGGQHTFSLMGSLGLVDRQTGQG